MHFSPPGPPINIITRPEVTSSSWNNVTHYLARHSWSEDKVMEWGCLLKLKIVDPTTNPPKEKIIQCDSSPILHLHANVHLVWTLIPDTGLARPGLGGYAGRVLKEKVIGALMGFPRLLWLWLADIVVGSDAEGGSRPRRAPNGAHKKPLGRKWKGLH